MPDKCNTTAYGLFQRVMFGLFFLCPNLSKQDRDFLSSLSVKDEQIEPMADRVYVLLKRFNFPKSTLGKNVIEKKCKVTATARNWNTANHVFDMMS